MKTILIADDHAFIRAGVEAVLTLAGYRVLTANNGQVVLNFMAQDVPDALVLDIMMPELTGIEVLSQLRAAGNNVPVVLLSAHIETGDLLTALTAGVNGIVFKDRAAEQLVKCLEVVGRGEKFIDRALLDLALTRSLAPPTVSPLDELTPRERDVVLAVAQGMRNREIGNHLGMSEGTVKVYLNSIYQRLGVSNRTSLALLVSEHRAA